MVFEAEGLDEHDYLNHVGKTAATASPITFHCRYAMLGAGDGDDTAYVFLFRTRAMVQSLSCTIDFIPVRSFRDHAA